MSCEFFELEEAVEGEMGGCANRIGEIVCGVKMSTVACEIQWQAHALDVIPYT